MINLEIGTVLTCNKNLEMFAGRQAIVEDIQEEEVIFKIAFAHFTCTKKYIPFYFTADELLINPKEFFSKTKNIMLKVNRVVLDNCRCNIAYKMLGSDFRGLLDVIKSECDTDDEYIMIFKTQKGFLVYQEVTDSLGDEFINEWEVAC